jgi:hypothetical protein
MMMKTQRRSRKHRRRDRGSALLVSLMVIVGLSLLGLGFVAISETETAIAKNEQNALQTQAIAEAGAKVVVEWFQDPGWSETNAALPTNSTCATFGTAPCSTSGTPGQYMKTVRLLTGYTGVYKSEASTKLCDKPYRPQNYDRLFGTEATADIIINATTNSTALANFNNVLLGTDRTGGEVSEIRIYAPPIVGGTLNGNGFWESNGQRYGVATIKVTAQQYADSAKARIRASHAVRVVVGEVPIPIPGGPIQSNTAISFGGDFVVHWGNETSTGTLDNKRNPSSLPWANAYERPHFERGFEPGTKLSRVEITNGGAGYVAAPTVSFAGAGGAGAAATATVTSGRVTAITLTNRGANYINTPGAGGVSGLWGPQVTISAPPAGGTQATAIAFIGAEAWPITGSQFNDADFFNEIIGKSYEDPWFGSRAVGDNLADGSGPASPTNAQCYPYAYTNNEATPSNAPYFFQWQSANLYPWQKVVTFPSILYNFWKKITSQARGYKGLYYFKNDGANLYLKFGTGTAKEMVKWANALGTANLGPGVYFFDSLTNVDPQSLTGAAKTAVLAGSEVWNSSDYGSSGGPSFLMQGFYYLNTTSFGTKGMGSKATTVKANFPGEPFRDIGYPYWCTAAGTPAVGVTCTAANVWSQCPVGTSQMCYLGAGDGIFSYQDLNSNGRFDVVTMSAPAWNSYDPAATPHAAGTTYIVKTWKSSAQAIADYGNACTIPAATYDGTSPGANDCTEPSEPYLNIVYPATSTANCTVGWEAPGSQTYRAKVVDSTGTPATCAASPTPSPSDCTSNAFDLDGAVVDIDVILDGVLYNEGDYDSQGNAAYYGSLLINGSVSGTGTPDIWFDEKLLKGSWAPPGMPRVMIFSMQTDESSGT